MLIARAERLGLLLHFWFPALDINTGITLLGVVLGFAVGRLALALKAARCMPDLNIALLRARLAGQCDQLEPEWWFSEAA
jgi:hypothetical protein